MEPYFAIAIFTVLLAWCSHSLGNPTVARNKTSGITAEVTGTRGSPVESTNKIRWNIFDYAIAASLVTFSALRFNVGTDYNAYVSIYNSLGPDNWLQQIQLSDQEPGYTLFSLLIKRFSDSPSMLLWATSLLTVLPIYATIKKSSQNQHYSVALYIALAFYLGPFNIIRQGVAVALSFWANSFLETNKKAFWLINIVATSFHFSAAIFAIFQWATRRWSIRPSHLIPILGVGVATAFILSSFPSASVIVGSINPRYEGYVNSELASAAGAGTYLLIATRVALLILAVTLMAGNQKGTPNGLMRWAMYVTVGLSFMVVGTQAIVFSRLEAYLGIYLILLVPNALDQTKSHALAKLGILAGGATYFYFYLANYGDLVPYQSYI